MERRVTTADLAKIFKALGDPTRLAIFELVRDCGRPDGCSDDDVRDNLTSIADRFGLSLSTVSHHVKELRSAGLITCEKRGQRLFCWVEPEVLAHLEQFAAGDGAKS
jgi:DNA-binding transcriptional ArsR family regulator